MNITREELDYVFEKYPANLWTKLVFKYFSKETDKKDMIPRKVTLILLLVFFFIGLFGTILKAPRALIGTATFVYLIILVLLVLFVFIGGKMNDKRISKIRKELGLSIEEYNRLIDFYY